MVAPQPDPTNGRSHADDQDPRRRPGVPEAEGLRPLLAQIAELREYATHYLSTRADILRLRARRIGLTVALGAVGGILGIVALSTAVVYVLRGMSGGLGELLGGRVWAGDLITGLGILAVVAVAAYVSLPRWMNTSRRRTVEKYELRRQKQRVAFGHDVRQRARE